ncbi:MAG: hypothetical protein IPK94_00870 [Saprospiraceae bacterium]|nr:hypothetical protein [Saprospiraceae bacterium]
MTPAMPDDHIHFIAQHSDPSLTMHEGQITIGYVVSFCKVYDALHTPVNICLLISKGKYINRDEQPRHPDQMPISGD